MYTSIIFLCFIILSSQQELNLKCSVCNREDEVRHMAILEEKLLTNVRSFIMELVERKLLKERSSTLPELAELKTQLQNVRQDLAVSRQDVQRLQNKRTTCEHGTTVISPNYPNRLGPVESVRISFDKAFSSTPIISLGISSLDVDKNHNLRIQTYARDDSPRGFTLHVRHWADTKIYKVWINWMACPSA